MNPAAFGFDASTCTGAASTVSGTYLKVTSQFPGEGPCYPAWVETKEVYHRWVAQGSGAGGGRWALDKAGGSGAKDEVTAGAAVAEARRNIEAAGAAGAE